MHQDFNPLKSKQLFAAPERLLKESAWNEHIPFAMLLVELQCPRVIVELGTHCGVSYCVFCQAVKETGAVARCYAIDTWTGDSHTGPYRDDVYENLKAHHKQYESFSQLLRMTFDEALQQIPDNSVDLLHIDGLHTYEAVKRDYNAWLPKMSDRGIILFHDTVVTERDFGVHRLWRELTPSFLHFNFEHGCGLGVLAVGKYQPEAVINFLQTANANASSTRELFSSLGRRLQAEIMLADRQQEKTVLSALKAMPALWNRIVSRYKKSGVRGIVSAIDQRLRGKSTGLPEFHGCERFFRNKYGLEIGGPSAIFQADALCPVYSLASRIDGCNFGTSTVWEGSIQEGMHYIAGNKLGYQFIAEASNLQMIPSNKYDFVLASHCLEHMANPLCAFQEWLRVLKKNGLIFLVLPDKRETFDHRRPVTAFSHLVRDLEMQTPEDDLTHLEEILMLHDLALDPLAGNFEAFEKRSRANFHNRCLHHHVFDLSLMREVFDYFGLQRVLSATAKPYHLIGIGRKRRE